MYGETGFSLVSLKSVTVGSELKTNCLEHEARDPQTGIQNTFTCLMQTLWSSGNGWSKNVSWKTKKISERFSRGIGLNIIILGIVSLCTDLSSQMVFPLIPLYLTSVLAAGHLSLTFPPLK